MASVLKSFGPPDAVATAEFCEKMDKFFDCFNVRNTTEGERTRKASMLPYKDVNDERFSLLPDDFVKGELRPEISLLHIKVLTLIKAKSNVFL